MSASQGDWRTWLRDAKVLSVFVLASVGAASIFTFVIQSPQWEARATIQIGRVAQTPIESPARTIARMRGQQFILTTLSAMGIRDSDAPAARLVGGSLRIHQLPDTDFLELRLRAYDRDQARELAGAFVEALASIHERVAEPSITRLKASQAEAQRAVERFSSERELYRSAVATQKPGRPNDPALLALAVMQLSTAEEGFARANERLLTIREQLNSAQTYPSSTIEPVSVSANPVVPQPFINLGVAAILGAVAGFLFVTTRASSRADAGREG